MFARCLRLSPLAVASLAATAHAEIDYHVSVEPDQGRIEVSIAVPAGPGPVSVQIPNWMPGSYAYGNFYENIHDVAASQGKNKPLAIVHPDKNTWTTTPDRKGTVTFTYWLPTGGQRRFAQANDSSFVQVSGAATYMYVVDRKTESCKVTFDVPKGWPILVGLDAYHGALDTFTAPSYDVLADNPVSTGDVIVEQYNLRGKDHFIVLEGAAKKDIDRTRLVKDCRFVSAAETDFFGGAPYHKYVWHFIVYPSLDGGGGLEHLSSTQISLSSGEGPRAQSVLAHEFFHLWNVKRARAKVLGPFDYLTLPKTGNLWWLEGVTDYYANLLPYRYGEWDRQMFLDAIVRNLNAIKTNPARLEVSPYEASYRVDEANGGRGNSNGYRISYYNLGWLCGLCLDIEIRAQTNSKYSLDDVARALYDLCKDNKPGFEEDEIRKQCVRFGGPALGPFFDKVVMSPGELPISEQLAKAGLVMDEHDESFVDTGFTAVPGFDGQSARITAVSAPGEGKLQPGDVITAIDGLPVGSTPALIAKHLQEVSARAQPGTSITLDFTRGGGQSMHAAVDPVQGTRRVRKVVEDGSASAAAIALRESWLKTKTPAVQ